MATIGSLSARILADAAGIKSGMGLTRDELKLTRQAFLDSRTDAEKLNQALATLESARGKGAFKNEADYAKAIAAVRREFDPAAKAAAALAAQNQALAGSIQQVAMQQAGAIPGARSLMGVFSGGHPALIAATAGLAAFAAGLAAVIAIGRAFVGTVRQQFDEVDKLGKAARNLGIDPESLVTIDLAARRSGVETEKLTGALQKMNRTLGQAEFGQSGAARALSDLGLSARQLQGLRPEQQLATLGEAIRRLPTAAQQAAAASAIFGRETKDLMGVLKLTTAEMEAFAKEAESARLGFSAEDSAQVERLNDAVDSLRDVWAGLGREVAIAVAPALADAAVELRKLAMDPEIQAGMDSLVESLQTVAYVAPIAAKGLGTAANEAGRFAGLLGMMQMPPWMQILITGGDIAGAGSDRSWTSWITGGLGDAEKQAQQLEKQLEATRQKLGIGDNALPVDLADEPDAATAGIQSTIDSLREQAETYGMSAERIAIYRAAKAGASAEELAEISRLQEEIRLRREEAESFQALAAAAAEETQFTIALSPETEEAIKWMEEARKQQEQLDKSLASTISRLQEQTATAGMSTDQAELWKLAQQGATAEQLAQVESLQQQAAAAKAAADQTAGLADETRALAGVNAALAGSAEAAEAIQRFRAQAGAQEVAVAADLLPGPLPLTFGGTIPPAAAPAPDNREAVWQEMLDRLSTIAENSGKPAIDLDVEEVSA
jgi:hypothetical protein